MTKSHDVHSLSHTKWNCKYHIFFAPKYRRKVFFGQKRYEIGQIMKFLFYPIRALMSSSTLPMPPMPKFSTSTLATLGDRKAGRVGPR